MKMIAGSIVAIALAIACVAVRASAAYIAVSGAAQQLSPEETDLINRGTHALYRYFAACSHRDRRELARIVTDDAAVEFPLKMPGTNLSVYAKDVARYCRIAPASTNIAELSVYPTNATDVLLVSYSVKSPRRAAAQQMTEHLALLQMRQERILRIRDFSATRADLQRIFAHRVSVSGAK